MAKLTAYPPTLDKVLERARKYEPRYEASLGAPAFVQLDCIFTNNDGYATRIEPRLGRLVSNPAHRSKPDSRGNNVQTSDRRAWRPDGEVALRCTDKPGRQWKSMLAVEFKPDRPGKTANYFKLGSTQIARYMRLLSHRPAGEADDDFEPQGLLIVGKRAHLFRKNPFPEPYLEGDLTDINSPVTKALIDLAYKNKLPQPNSPNTLHPPWFQSYVDGIASYTKRYEDKFVKGIKDDSLTISDMGDDGLDSTAVADGDDEDPLDAVLFAPPEASLYAIFYAVFLRNLPTEVILTKPQSVIRKTVGTPSRERGHSRGVIGSADSMGAIDRGKTEIGCKPDFVGVTYGRYRANIPVDNMVYYCEVKPYDSPTMRKDVLAQISNGMTLLLRRKERYISEVHLFAMLGVRVWKLTGEISNANAKKAEDKSYKVKETVEYFDDAPGFNITELPEAWWKALRDTAEILKPRGVA